MQDDEGLGNSELEETEVDFHEKDQVDEALGIASNITETLISLSSILFLDI